MEKRLLKYGLMAVLLSASSLMAQNVGIGTNTPAEKLHVVGNVRVSNLAGVGTRMVGADANGTLVVVAAGTNGQVLTQTAGGPAWQPITAWLTTGNSSTVAGTNFIGTLDAVDFVTRTNNTEAMRVTTAQRVGIGTATPTVKLEVSSGTTDAIYGHSNNVGSYIGYETNFTFGTPAQNLLGAGVWASNPAAGYTSTFAQSSGAATVAAAITYSNVWMSSYNYVENASATFNPSANYNQLNVTNAGLAGFKIALRGYNNRDVTAGNPGYTVGVEGIADAQNEDAFGVEGVAYSNSNTRAGGYFEALNFTGTSQAFAYVGTTVTGVARKITGTNAVSEIVPTANHGRVMLTAPESPEYFYQDYGTVTMTNGVAHVELDPILADIIVVDADYPIRAFATPVNMPNFNGVTMMNQTATGFDFVELNGGNHSGQIHYQLIVRPMTGHGEGRFPQAPGPAGIKADQEPAAAKAANQPNPANIFYWPADHVVYGYDPAEVAKPGDVVRGGTHNGKFKVAEGVYENHIPATKPR